MAASLDRFGGVVCAELFNAVLIKKESIYPFGIGRETVSSVLGKNELACTLSYTGYLLVRLLNMIDKGHCKKSIQY